MPAKQTSLVFILISLLSLPSYCQVTISGLLTDKSSGERLEGVRVSDSFTNRATLSNKFGFYSITLPKGEVKICVAYSGYKTQYLEYYNDSDTIISISLDAIEFQLGEIEIIDDEAERQRAASNIGVVEIPIQQIEILPSFLGEADVIKALQLMPGISGGSEGNSGLYVRGGGSDQNLFLIDGVPLYNITHLGGFFSALNPDAVSQVKLYKGGFPARYGGKLSSILDVQLKEGDIHKFRGKGSIGIISSKVSIEGPIQKGKSSFIISGRRTYSDIILRPLTNRISGGNLASGYRFYDLNGKVGYQISEKDRLFVSFFIANDQSSGKGTNRSEEIKSEYSLTTGWGSHLASIGWNKILNKKLFGNFSIGYSQYQLQNTFEGTTEDLTSGSAIISLSSLSYSSRIQDLSSTISFDWYPSHNHKVKFGGGAILHRFEPSSIGSISQGASGFIDTTFGYPIERSLETNIFVEDQILIGDRISMNLGLRGNLYLIDDYQHLSLLPRVSILASLHDNISVEASFSKTNQFTHLLVNSGVGLPLDLWVPAKAEAPVQQSWLVTTGVSIGLFDKAIISSVELYYKELDGLIAYKEGTNFFLGSQLGGWEAGIESNGQGNTYGAEFLFEKKQGRTTGWIGYTLSRNWRTFENINEGMRFPYRYDRRHDLSIVIIHRINKNISISGSWGYRTGDAITLPTGQHPTALDPLFSWVNVPGSTDLNIIDGERHNPLPFFYGEYGNTTYPTYIPYRPPQNDVVNQWGWGANIYEGGRNNFRMQDYHRLDVSLNFSKDRKHGKGTWTFGFYNVYNRLNPYAYYLSENTFFDESLQRSVTEVKLMKLVLFPILPTISYKLEF